MVQLADLESFNGVSKSSYRQEWILSSPDGEGSRCSQTPQGMLHNTAEYEERKAQAQRMWSYFDEQTAKVWGRGPSLVTISTINYVGTLPEEPKREEGFALASWLGTYMGWCVVFSYEFAVRLSFDGGTRYIWKANLIYKDLSSQTQIELEPLLSHRSSCVYFCQLNADVYQVP